MIPVYGFLEGDTIGLLIFAYEDETVKMLIDKLQKSSQVRVAPRENMELIFQGKIQNKNERISKIGIGPLDRFDVLSKESCYDIQKSV